MTALLSANPPSSWTLPPARCFLLLRVRLNGENTLPEQTCAAVVNAAVRSLYGKDHGGSWTVLGQDAVGRTLLAVEGGSSLEIQAALALCCSYQGQPCRVEVVAESASLLALAPAVAGP